MRYHVTGVITDGSRVPELLQEENRVVGELRSEGTLEHLFLRADRQGAFFVVAASSQDELTRAMDRLPFVAEGIMTWEAAELA